MPWPLQAALHTYGCSVAAGRGPRAQSAEADFALRCCEFIRSETATHNPAAPARQTT